MEKAQYNTELYSNLRVHLNNVKPSNFWGSHQNEASSYYMIAFLFMLFSMQILRFVILQNNCIHHHKDQKL